MVCLRIDAEIPPLRESESPVIDKSFQAFFCELFGEGHMLTMTDLTNAAKRIDGKLRFLEFISEETDEIIQKNERNSVERQIKIYEAKFDEIKDLKLHIQELKLQAEEDPSEVKKWRLIINQKQSSLNLHIKYCKR